VEKDVVGRVWKVYLYIAKSIMIKNDLKIPDAYKDDPEYNKAKTDLDNEIKQYKIHGSGCYKRAAQAGINCAVRARTKCFVKLVTPLARHVVKSLCEGNSMIRRDHWNVPVERRTMACIIALLDQEHKTNPRFFDEYLNTPRDAVVEKFLAKYKETPPLLRQNNTTPFVATLANMRSMGNNAQEYKTLVQEGTKYISRLIIAYTQGIQIQFHKVQNRRAEINRLRSQMLAEKKASVTEATGKAIVDLTEKTNENGNHMEMKLVQIVDDRSLKRTLPKQRFGRGKKGS
jgi:hypothetical protein